MFDLTKDVDKCKGVPPYASEHFGVYQPLLGWQSQLTKKWLAKGGTLVDPRIKRILDGRITPGPQAVMNPHPLEFLAQPMEPGAGPIAVQVADTKDLNSELMSVIAAKVQVFVDAHDGELPAGQEWTQVVDINSMMDADAGDLCSQRRHQATDLRGLPPRRRRSAHVGGGVGARPPDPAAAHAV